MFNRCRLYYRDDGSIYTATLGPPWQDDPDGMFIETDPQWFEKVDFTRNKIHNSQVITIDLNARNVVKLVKSSSGDLRTVAGAMSLLLEHTDTWTETDRYEIRNDRHSGS